MISEADIKFPDIPFRKTALLIIIGLVLYFGYLYLVGFNTVRDELAKVNLWLVALAFVIALGSNVFHAAGWWVLLRHMKYRLSLGRAYLIYLSSIFFTNLVPSAALSGEVAKIYFVQKSLPETRFDRIFAAGLMDRLLEVVPVAIGAILGVAYLALFYSLPLWALALCALLAGGIAVAALFILAVARNARLLRRTVDALFSVAAKLLRGRSLGGAREKANALVAQFEGSMREMSASPGVIAWALALIIIAWLCDVSVAYVAFLSVGYAISPGVIVTVYSMMVLVTLIPAFVPGGLGYVDGLLNLLFSLAGVRPSDAFSGTFVMRLVTLWFLTAVGGLATLFLARATAKAPPGP